MTQEQYEDEKQAIIANAVSKEHRDALLADLDDEYRQSKVKEVSVAIGDLDDMKGNT